MQFAKNMADGKYDWTADGKQQLLLPSEFKKACAAKTPCPVISWLPEIIHVCWKIASELIVKLDTEKGIARSDLFDWISNRGVQEERKPPVDTDGNADAKAEGNAIVDGEKGEGDEKSGEGEEAKEVDDSAKAPSEVRLWVSPH